jgi:long-chain acyl-CoA synthetase
MSEPFDTINTRFAEAARKYADRPALSSKPSRSKTWETLTYQNLSDRVRQVALGLRALGIERGDRVALLSENRPEWAIADLAILAAGGVSVPVYPTLPASQVAHILADSGAKAIIAENAKQAAKVTQVREAAPALSVVITLEDSVAKDGILSLAGVIQAGEAATFDESYEARRDSIRPEDLMSLVYTSGTTGNPKGAMLTHGNMAAAVDAANHQFPQFQPPNDVFLSFLPLSHVFERVTYTLSITMGAHTRFNDSIFKLMDNLGELQPTVMQCVPRVHESIHDRVADGIAKLPARRKTLTYWSLGVGDSVSRKRNAGEPISPLQFLRFLVAERLVLSKIRARFGGHLKFFVSGGAALNPKTAHFFLAIGIPILEGWGLTETTAAATANISGHVKVGTVGPRMFNVQVKTADDGELLVKGPTVMRGYWNNLEATADVIDADGWFHTGDIGEIDAEGYVKITDRKKDILVLANGKKVAPQPIEMKLKRSPLLTEVVLLGDNSGSVGALVVPNFDALKTWAKEQGKDLNQRSADRRCLRPQVRQIRDRQPFQRPRRLREDQENRPARPCLHTRRRRTDPNAESQAQSGRREVRLFAGEGIGHSRVRRNDHFITG